MPILRTSRPLTPIECAHLQSFRAPSPGVFPWFANLVLIPMVFGGLFGWLLSRAHIPESRAYLIGVVVALLAGAVRLRHELVEDRRFWAPYAAAHIKALSTGTVETFSFTPLAAWEVVDVEDAGPAYLFDTDSGTFVFLCSPDLPAPESGSLAVGPISAEVIPHVERVLALQVLPGAVPLRSPELTLDQVGASVFTGLIVIPREVVAAALTEETGTA